MRFLPIVALAALVSTSTVSAAGLNPPPASALGCYQSYELA